MMVIKSEVPLQNKERFLVHKITPVHIKIVGDLFSIQIPFDEIVAVSEDGLSLTYTDLILCQDYAQGLRLSRTSNIFCGRKIKDHSLHLNDYMISMYMYYNYMYFTTDPNTLN